MEESTYEAIFIGVYVFIFVIALSVTIYLFLGINSLADNAYEYANQKTGGSSITNARVPRYRLMTASEVLSFVSNYRFMDNYANSEDSYNNSEFKVSVKLENNNSTQMDIASENSNISTSITTYRDLLDKIDKSESARYILDYKELEETIDEYGIVTNKKSSINIRKATDEEINLTY